MSTLTADLIIAFIHSESGMLDYQSYFKCIGKKENYFLTEGFDLFMRSAFYAQKFLIDNKVITEL